jgi:hypothetical protein
LLFTSRNRQVLINILRAVAIIATTASCLLHFNPSLDHLDPPQEKQYNLGEPSKLMGLGKLFRRIVGSQLVADCS